MSRPPRIAVLDYGSGNLRSAQRALPRAGADAEVTADQRTALDADGLVVPGVGAFAACMAGLRAVGGEQIIAKRLAAGRPVLGICVGMQVLFEAGVEHGERTAGCGCWPGVVERLTAPVLPHMGWNTVRPPAGSRLLAGLGGEQMFYFVHSYAVLQRTAGQAAGTAGAAAAGHLGHARRAVRGRGGGRAAGRHPVPPREVRRRGRGAARQLAGDAALMKAQPSTLTLLPAVDVADGQAVRLVQGAAGTETAVRRPARRRPGLAGGRGRVDPPGRPGRGLRPRVQRPRCSPR